MYDFAQMNCLEMMHELEAIVEAQAHQLLPLGLTDGNICRCTIGPFSKDNSRYGGEDDQGEEDDGRSYIVTPFMAIEEMKEEGELPQVTGTLADDHGAMVSLLPLSLLARYTDTVSCHRYRTPAGRVPTLPAGVS